MTRPSGGKIWRCKKISRKVGPLCVFTLIGKISSLSSLSSFSEDENDSKIGEEANLSFFWLNKRFAFFPFLIFSSAYIVNSKQNKKQTNKLF